MTNPKPNLPLLRRVFKYIDEHPDEWYQKVWGIITPESSCGTAFCVAGHALVMSGYTTRPVAWTLRESPQPVRFVTPQGIPVSHMSIIDHAQEVLGLTRREAELLFNGENNRQDIQHIAEEIAKRAGEQFVLDEEPEQMDMGNIGDDQHEVEFEPLTRPEEVPEPVPAPAPEVPAEPEKVPV